ncbi:Gfo/Idh/MocA family oxidoreductase [Prosthecobacter sp.]|uniref:Gfo/Idh/MocA family protein n=1 Tax=Prosthecobacter sp. TaxID=1965333 RepID=UPI00248A44CB|nr:Gfo/Idh/MocA family oxidoreductase [Prosthecobacter sp.]MDI1311382.1 Gfo/Idh/MocA family oxidoreductase [Prosthecobacter sp.]
MQDRRHFIAKTAAAFAGIQILPRSVFGANEKLNIAFVGAGGKGWHAVQSLLENPMVNYVAFADVDEPRAAQSRQAKPDVPFHSDFRKMLDQHGKNIDGVIISTPDQTHHYNAKWCMNAGKHVYLEKPLTHNIAEARDLMALEKTSRLACQMGNQGHSGGGILMLEAWAKAGILGDVTDAHAWAGPIWSVADERPPEQPVPAGLDWNQWIGPAAMVPHSSRYLPAVWRAWFEFGCGTLGDWACHNMDAPYAVWGLDCPSRVEIESTGPKKLSFPDTVRVTFTFPTSSTGKEFKIHWYHGKGHAFTRPAELEASRALADGGTFIRGSKSAVLMGTHAGIPRIIPEVKMQELASSLPKVDLKRSNHWDNWLLAIKGQEKPRSNFAYGGRLTETMHFANIALHVNRNLTIDPATRSIVGDAEAAALMNGPNVRQGWTF